MLLPPHFAKETELADPCHSREKPGHTSVRPSEQMSQPGRISEDFSTRFYRHFALFQPVFLVSSSACETATRDTPHSSRAGDVNQHQISSEFRLAGALNRLVSTFLLASPQRKSGMSQQQSESIPTAASEATVEQIAKLRLVIARFGEMDRAKWWNTKGMLANLGEMAISRGFAKTHLFARAQAVFAVASHRCDEIFNPPEACTLWKLPPAIEEKLQDAWAKWLEQPAPWTEFLQQVNQQQSSDLLQTLLRLNLISEAVADQVRRLRRADDARSVPLTSARFCDDASVALLAAAFSRGESGKLAVPWIVFGEHA